MLFTMIKDLPCPVNSSLSVVEYSKQPELCKQVYIVELSRWNSSADNRMAHVCVQRLGKGCLPLHIPSIQIQNACNVIHVIQVTL